MSNFIKNPVTEACLNRRSIRRFEPGRQISGEQLDTIIECGIWAPSAMNLQTTKIVSVQDTAIFMELENGFRAYMSAQASPPPPPPDGRDSSFLYKAPTLLLVYGGLDERRKAGNAVLSVENERWKAVNAALAAENMCLAAHSLGLSTVILGFFKHYMDSDGGRKFSAGLGVPEDYDFICAVAVGYAGMDGLKQPRKEGNVTKL